MTLDEALAEPGPLLVARDLADDDAATFHVLSVAAGAARLASATVPPARRLAVTLDLLRSGHRVGRCYGATGIAWLAEAHAFTIWTRHARAARCDRLALARAAGEPIPCRDVTALVAFLADDHVRRGVAVERAAGDSVVLVDEHDSDAALDPTYGRDDLIMSDAWWAPALARDLGDWLGVPWRDEVFGLTPAPAAVHAVLRAAAGRLAALPDTAPFLAIDLPFTARDVAAVLRLAPDPAGRRLELRLGDAVQALARGPADELALWLREPESPLAVTRVFNRHGADAP